MRQTSRSWTEQDCEKLRALVRAGASPFRASVALGRSAQIVKHKARALGCPFPHLREVKSRTRELLSERNG